MQVREYKLQNVFHFVISITIALQFGCSLGGADQGVVRHTKNANGAFLSTEQSGTIVLGHSIENRPIECLSVGSGHEVVLFIATIHGNESAGTPLLLQLDANLRANPLIVEDRRAVMIPVANPDGYHHRRRLNVRGVDLNRNFPTHNWKKRKRYGLSPLSEPESRAIQLAIDQYQPSRIISIHQPASCLDYDGPGLELAKAMSVASDLKIKRLGAKPGSLGSYGAEVLGISVITIELPRRASKMDDEELWNRYGPMLVAAVRWKAAIGIPHNHSVADVDHSLKE